jgi:hypothetical protein
MKAKVAVATVSVVAVVCAGILVHFTKVRKKAIVKPRLLQEWFRQVLRLSSKTSRLSSA